MQNEIDGARQELKAALWQNPADMETARVLASKIVGLRICAGEIPVSLRTPVIHIVDSNPLAA